MAPTGGNLLGCNMQEKIVERAAGKQYQVDKQLGTSSSLSMLIDWM